MTVAGVFRKLKDEKGASITFALLAFLVCAVISSVVITAGTAAAGRMSQMAESDRRYYAVKSAAELMGRVFDGKTAEVEILNETGDVVSSAFYKTGDKSAAVTDKILEDASLTFASYLFDPSAPVNYTKTYNLTTDITGEGTALNCTVTTSMKNDGTLTFKVSSKPETAGSTKVYTIWVSVAPNSSKVAGERTVTAGDAVVVQPTTRIKMNWKLHSVQKWAAA